MPTYIAVFAMVLAYVALVAAYCALRTLAKLRRATTALSRGARGAQRRETLIEATARHAETTAALGQELDELRELVERTRTEVLTNVQSTLDAHDRQVAGVLRNVALVRYDAFSDMSGRMSFSLAILDEGGDGVTISALAGHSDTRVYAKGVRNGKGEHELSPEEKEAVRAAVSKVRAVTARKAG